MIFDPSFVSAWHAGLVLAVAGAVGSAIALMLKIAPASLKSGNIYFAGWIVALVVGVAAAVYLRSSWLGLGILIATLEVIAIGRLDEMHRISWRLQLLAQVGIALAAVVCGWVIPYVSNPIHGGVMLLNHAVLLGITPGGILAFLFIIACMNAMNFFDGADGLAPSVGAITCLALAGISILPATQDMRTFTLALIGFSACAAFFFWNAPQAKVYLGTTGSWFLGLYIALLAILGGGKIVTTLIVLALPVFDAIFVVVHRIVSGSAPWKGDTVRHVHHRLLAYGLHGWRVVAWMSACTALLALVGVAAPTSIKIIALSSIAAVFFLASSRMMKKEHI